jgi:hypothetical protein
MKIVYLRICVFTISLTAALFWCDPSLAWGCKGHQTVALIAEKHLTPEAKAFLEKLLKENPIDPQLKRYCGGFASSALADSSTWPDDVRNIVNNGRWHYINIPRGAAHAPLATFCGAKGCVTQAIAEQLAILKDPHADPKLRADAIRYIVHFVGDLHMPLHASTNNDEGGTCVPVRFFRRRPSQQGHSYVPNLHAVWDTLIPERDMEGADPSEYADFLERSFSRDIDAWQKDGINVEAWTWESHDLAEYVVYGELSPMDPVETPAAVASCEDADHVGERMLRMHFFIGESYQQMAGPIAEERLAQAGIRLAMILNDASSAASHAN